jgi:hypothetical protein
LEVVVRTVPVVIALTLVALPVAAQGMQPLGLHRLAEQPADFRPVHVDSIPRTHWLTGALIGLGLGLIVGNGVQHWSREICESSDCGSGSPMLYIAPMMIFGTIGGMIGSGSHKKPPRAVESGHDSLLAHRR